MRKIFVLIVGIFISVLATPCVFAKSIDVTYENGIYHAILKGERIKRKVKFVVSENLITNLEAHKRARSPLTINAGFFDTNNGKTTSYIVTERTTTADPVFNENLMNNSIIRQNLDKVLNRTELRVIECNNKYSYQIAPHNTSVAFGCNIVTSAQGGPQLLPEMRLEEEFFTMKKDDILVRDSIAAYRKKARTIVGIKDDNLHILVITTKNPMTLFEARDLCKSLGFTSAMGFDGGGSSSLDYKNKIHYVSENPPTGRAVKSFMIIQPTRKFN